MTDHQQRSKDEILRDGQEAADVLNHPMVKSFINNAKGELFTLFAATKLTEDGQRKEIWLKMQTIDWFVDSFKKYVNDAKMIKLDSERKVAVIPQNKF